MLTEVYQCLRRHNLSKTRFGRMLGDPRLIGDMENGRQLRPATEEKIRELIKELDA